MTTKAIKISGKSLVKFKGKNIVDTATDFVKDSIHINKVKGAIKECLEKHPELMNGTYTDVVAARILAQSVLYTIFGNTDLLLWKDTATRKQKSDMRACATDMFYIKKFGEFVYEDARDGKDTIHDSSCRFVRVILSTLNMDGFPARKLCIQSLIAYQQTTVI